MRRGAGIGAGVAGVALIGAAVVVAAAGFGGTGGRAPAATDQPPATTTVTRQTLTQTEQVDGTLGYGTSSTLHSHARGTVTWLPAAGSTVQRGQPVCRADNVPVQLWYGSLPLYRTLEPGVSGPDVTEVEQNLAALGYTGFTADDRYTSATADAVRRWQHDIGATQTGTVEASAVVLAAGAIRVATVSAAPGDAAGGPLFTYTATTRSVSIALDVSKQGLVRPGVTATVTLPDGRTTVAGTVSGVGTVATAGHDGSPATIDVTVDLADQSRLGTLDQAPVDVTLVSAKADNVLTVPVSALVALAEGGYGVQVVSGGATRYVAVQTGMFANNRVEVTGDGITAGTVVGVPK